MAYDISVSILRRPTAADWDRCKDLAMRTMGKRWTGDEVTTEWMHKMLKCRHSPIRTLMFTIEMRIPYFVSTHFVRHKIGVEHYVESQRNDRQSKYDREMAPQNSMVIHTMDINAESLMIMSNRRLCGQADPTTRFVMTKICRAVEEVNPEFQGHLVPMCAWTRHCPEARPCGWWENQCGTDRVEEMLDRMNIHLQIDDNPYIPPELRKAFEDEDGIVVIQEVTDLEALINMLTKILSQCDLNWTPKSCPDAEDFGTCSSIEGQVKFEDLSSHF